MICNDMMKMMIWCWCDWDNKNDYDDDEDDGSTVIVLIKQLLRYSSSLEGTSVAKTIDIDIDSFQYSTTAVRSADNINTIIK